ncbi:hypothetical protein LR48_Vigan11g076100 [Vigna angularis]|uniref:Uncharacterized protein n=1 Tax=Phaseolus angularis TaxID=3914 RepID=A0A0L9VS00_PHAAN|nr:hypothetical protein LR48_Vigan11g076100 [Vigna angularis]
MQKGREVRDDIFEPKGFGDFGGFGFHERMMPSLFGGRDPFDDPFFRDPFDSLFGSNSASRAMQNPNREKGVVIEELDSDYEVSDDCPQDRDKDFDQKKSRSTVEPSVEHPDDDDDSSRVTYGGIDGAYYTSTRTRRMGANGVVMEENKEADSTTGQATHRISRGIHDKVCIFD